MLNYVNKAIRKVSLYSYDLAPIVPLQPQRYSPLIKMANYSLPLFYYNPKFVRFLRKIEKNEGLNTKNNQEIISFLDPKYGFGPIINLYNLCFYYGNLEVLCKIRETALLALNKNHNTSILSLDKYLIKTQTLALAELGKDKELFNLIINNFSLISADKELYSNLYFQLSPKYREVLEAPDLELDYSFNSLVSGKTVAIVGPAASSTKSGNEIDSFDIVIRINFKGNKNFGDPIMNGERIDISYYNYGTTANLDESIFQGSLLSYVVPMNSTSYIKTNEKVRENTYSPRVLNGIPNMIQKIVFDILLYNPSSVKIFNCNFYAGKSIYDSSYQDMKKNELTIRNLALHDQWTQVCYIRNLYRNGLIQVDESCKNILDMSCKEYFLNLKSNFTIN